MRETHKDKNNYKRQSRNQENFPIRLLEYGCKWELAERG